MKMASRLNGEALNQFLKRIREELDISQHHWGLAMGVDQGQVSRWERGKGEPGVDNLKGLAKLLGTTVAVLIGEEAAPIAPPAPTPTSKDALDRLEAARLLLFTDGDTLDNVLRLLRRGAEDEIAAPSKKPKPSTG